MCCVFVWDKSSGHAAICVMCFSALVCVCARRELRWVTPGGQALAHFLFLSCVPQSVEALSPAICLPALGIVIPKYRPVNISLVTATPHSPTTHHSTAHHKQAREGRRCSLLTLLFCLFLLSLSLFLADSFASSLFPFIPSELQMYKTMRKNGLLFYLVLHVICLIKHWCSFNKTELMRLLNIDALPQFSGL